MQTFPYSFFLVPDQVMDANHTPIARSYTAIRAGAVTCPVAHQIGKGQHPGATRQC